MDWGSVAGGLSDGLQRNRQLRIQENRDARDAELHQFRLSEAQDRDDERKRLRAANQEAAQFALNYGQPPAAVQPPQVDSPGLSRISPAATGGAPEEGLQWSQGTKQEARDPDRVIGAMSYSRTERLGDPQYLDGMMRIYAKHGLIDKAKPYWEGLYNDEKMGAISTAIALTQGDPQTAFRINNERSPLKLAKPPEPVEGTTKWTMTHADGQTEVIDPKAILLSRLEPTKFFDIQTKFDESRRKGAESDAKVAEHGARTGLLEAQTEATRTNAASLEAYRQRGGRTPDSKESVDRAHQANDATLQRLATMTDPKGAQVIDPDSRKPVVDQVKLNKLTQLYNDVQLEVENVLGRELGQRELRLLGQRMATAPINDDAKRPAWMKDTVGALAGRPSARSGGPLPSRRQAEPPVPGARPVENPQTGERGWVIQGEDGRLQWRPMGPTSPVAGAILPQNGAVVDPSSFVAQSSPTASTVPAPAQSATPATSSQRLPTPQAAEATMASTRQAVAAAEARLQRYSMRSRRSDPEGYATARAAHEQASAAAAEAERVYRTVVGDQPVFARRGPGYADGGLVRRSHDTPAANRVMDGGLTRRKG